VFLARPTKCSKLAHIRRTTGLTGSRSGLALEFELTPEQRAELEPLLVQLQKWIDELEALDLEQYEPVLHPSPKNASGDD
jgi:hypothetical protein